ncbi:MAG: 30S ribosomal protein S12 methylthiotransferase RimO [Nevskia sp.]|nr:30S ribosomal protein S12 methylthiotransferase RimO [Nevskia sp.]
MSCAEQAKTNVGMISLGCAKNTVDTEVMLGLLDRDRYAIVPEAGAADVIVINTCGFLKAAEEEAINTILEMAPLHKKLVVAGCMVQRHQEELARLLPEVDAWVGTSEFAQISEVVRQVAEQPRANGPVMAVSPDATPRDPAGDIYPVDFPRYRVSGGPVAYVKIAEGCDHPCTYCIIPQLRGRFKSRPIAAVERELRQLVATGIREVVLIAQDSTSYGFDLPGRPGLHELLGTLAAVPGDFVLRLMYAYPGLVTDELLRLMAAEPKIARYLDMPLQHSHTEILQAMRRPHNEAMVEGLLDRIRAHMPDVALRTTFIVGFPGETEAHFAHLEAFVRRQRFEHVGVFCYSREDGTPAGAEKRQVRAALKTARRRRLMAVQQEVVREQAPRWQGRTLRLLVETAGARPDEWLGRTYRDAPDVDGVTYAYGAARPGEFVDVTIREARLYDLIGDIGA